MSRRVIRKKEGSSDSPIKELQRAGSKVDGLTSDANEVEPALDLNHFREFIRVLALTPPYFILLSKVMDSSNLDQLAKSVMNICQYHGTICVVLHSLIQSEFDATQETTIMRGNSLTTKLENLFCRSIGQPYLRDTFGSTILRIVTDCDLNLSTNVKTLEATPGVGHIETRIQENRQRIIDMAQELVDSFTSTAAIRSMPIPIRAIVSYTSYHATNKGLDTEAVSSYLGGFILLRFFIPSMITPESYNLLPDGITPTPQDRQNLIAITRLIQKLSNQVSLEDSSPDAWMNPFINRNRDKIRHYLSQLCEDPQGHTPPFSNLLEPQGLKNELGPRADDFVSPKFISFLHYSIFKYGQVLVKALTAYPPVIRDEREIRLDVELVRMIAGLGPPPSLTASPPTVTFEQFQTPDNYFWLPVRQTLEGTGIQPRNGQSTVVMNRHKAYFYGGCYVDGSMIEDDTSLLEYDMHESTWKLLGTADTPHRKAHAAAVSPGGDMYVFGGMKSNDPVNNLLVYHSQTGEWTEIQPLNTPPSPRYGHTMVFYENALYVFGGYCHSNEKFHYSNELCVFNLRTFKWSTEVHENGPSPRNYHTALVRNQCMWVFGGRAPDSEGLSDLHRFDFAKNSWRPITCRGQIPNGRWSHTMTLTSDASKLLILGGSHLEGYTEDTCEFEFDTQTWKQCNVDSALVRLPRGMTQHSAVVYFNMVKVFFGGTYMTTGTLSTEEFLLSCGLYSPEDYISEDWGQLYNQRVLSDVDFICGDNTITAHRLVLYARCPRLYELVNKSESRTVEVRGITYKLLSQILYYLYSGRQPPAEGLAESLDLLVWCRRLALETLLRRVELNMFTMITEKTLALILLTAERFDLPQLKIACILFLVDLCKRGNSSRIPFTHFSPHILSLLTFCLVPAKNINAK